MMITNCFAVSIISLNDPKLVRILGRPLSHYSKIILILYVPGMLLLSFHVREFGFLQTAFSDGGHYI
jgi:hypothetical protein